ncbi:MAG TPA: NAD(P)H-hydrate epimerase, partial [Bacteroidetes bacterium]|nr:NAD(P)H-hydrate epimerase [Bacteroidota bacterium]
MKVPSVEQIREADNYTISYEPIISIDLMERASQVFVNWFSTKVKQNKRIIVCAGKGNNGGDGLAIARLLNKMKYDVSVIILNYTDNASKDFSINFERIKKIKAISITELNSDSKPPDLSSFDVVIDALWGSGLSRPIDFFSEKFIDNINSTDTKVYSVDIPSGLHADKYINSINDELLPLQCVLKTVSTEGFQSSRTNTIMFNRVTTQFEPSNKDISQID